MFDLRWTPPRLPLAARAAAFGVFVVFIAVGIAQGWSDRAGLAVAGGLLGVAAAAASLMGRPAWCVPAAVVSAAGIVVEGTGQSFNVAWFGFCILAGWLILAVPLWQGLAFFAATELVIAAQAVFAERDPGWGAWAAGTLFSAIGCLLGQHQQQLLDQLRSAQAELAARATAEERTRIARELHDVIAHTLTVSLLHISSARLAVADDPASAEAALAEAERLGRSSLDEVRHTVGLLRTEADPTAPLPGSTDLAELIARFRRTGGSITARLAPMDDVPAVVGLAAHRIVQEALTNALHHAPGAAVRVEIARSDDALAIEVDCAGPPAPGERRGHGLIGMRERAASVGGTCWAGPGGSGWLVRAHLPVAAAVDPAPVPR